MRHCHDYCQEHIFVKKKEISMRGLCINIISNKYYIEIWITANYYYYYLKGYLNRIQIKICRTNLFL